MYTKGVISSSQYSDPLMNTLMSLRATEQTNVSEEEKKEAKELNVILLNNIASTYMCICTYNLYVCMYVCVF